MAKLIYLKPGEKKTKKDFTYYSKAYYRNVLILSVCLNILLILSHIVR